MDKLLAMERFARIVEKGSLTAAAADCATSLPSMVRSLATLERSLGVTLLNRTTRRVNPPSWRSPSSRLRMRASSCCRRSSESDTTYAPPGPAPFRNDAQ